MAAYLSRAVASIQENGDDVERARLAGLLGRYPPDTRILRSLTSRQHDDGGFPYGMIPGRASSVAATAKALRWIEDLRMLPAASAQRAASFLLMVQRPDGAWDESPAVVKFDPPPRLRPGTPFARRYCTGVAAIALARVLGPSSDAVGLAAEFLRAHRDGAAPVDEVAETAALETSVLMLAGGRSAAVAADAAEALSRVPVELWTVDRLTNALSAFHTAGLSADDPMAAWAIRGLLEAQAPDGGWRSALGPDHDVEVSLDALSVLSAFGIASGR
ncbi:MAG TPA: prenyltransferase/squalene oxidase repeat-containing protein [bacterium]|jgi:hypothetical protein|nr:prenyltransferase/squalene oxidase repeat-containing protein [bacterium]